MGRRGTGAPRTFAADCFAGHSFLSYKYSGKLRDAHGGTESAADRSQTTGSFLAAALTQALGGGGNEAERTANATEQMARTTKETNKILKKMGRGGSSESTLAYT